MEIWKHPKSSTSQQSLNKIILQLLSNWGTNDGTQMKLKVIKVKKEFILKTYKTKERVTFDKQKWASDGRWIDTGLLRPEFGHFKT